MLSAYGRSLNANVHVDAKKAKVRNDHEMAQSERNSHSKNQGGKKR